MNPVRKSRIYLDVAIGAAIVFGFTLAGLLMSSKFPVEWIVIANACKILCPASAAISIWSGLVWVKENR